MVQRIEAWGNTLEFPDDMSDDDMANAIRQNEAHLNPKASTFVKAKSAVSRGIDAGLGMLAPEKSIADQAVERSAETAGLSAPQVKGAPVRRDFYNRMVASAPEGAAADDRGIVSRTRNAAAQDKKAQLGKRAVSNAFTSTEPEESIGLLGTLKEGVKGTARNIGAAIDTVQGDGRDVVSAAKDASGAPKDPRLEALLGDIAKRKAMLNENSGWLDAAKTVGGAALDNPKGAGLLLAEQFPNSAAALGAGFAGMKLGAAAGSIAGPAGALPGAVIGGLAGLFGANTALETGGKAIEAAGDGSFGVDEQRRVLKEGAIKGGVITGIDAATLGLTNFITGTTRRAVERATAKTLADHGVDVSSKEAVLAATKNPAIVSSVQAAQKLAQDASSTLGKNLARGTGAMGLETIGEGAGEYIGEFAATGKADKVEAVIEAFSSLGQSAGEVAFTAVRNKAKLETISGKPVTELSDSVLRYTANRGGERAKAAAQAEMARRAAEGVDPDVANATETTGEAVDRIINTGRDKADEIRGAREAIQDSVLDEQDHIADAGNMAAADHVPDAGKTIDPTVQDSLTVPDAPTPEPVETLNAQLNALAEGRKPAMLLTPGEPMPTALPEGVQAAEIPGRGTLLYRDEATLQAAMDGRMGDALGYGTSEKPVIQEGGSVDAATARDARGTVIQDVAMPADDAGRESVLNAAATVAGENGSVEVRPVQEALSERAGNPLDPATIKTLKRFGYSTEELSNMSSSQARDTLSVMSIIQKDREAASMPPSSDPAAWAERMDYIREIEGDVANGRIKLPKGGIKTKIQTRVLKGHSHDVLAQEEKELIEWAEGDREEAIAAVKREIEEGRFVTEKGVYWLDLLDFMNRKIAGPTKTKAISSTPSKDGRVARSAPMPSVESESREAQSPAGNGSVSNEAQSVHPVRPLVESLIKRRAAAKQGGKDLSKVIGRAKEVMDGKRADSTLEHKYFRLQAKAFEKADPEAASVLRQIAEAVKGGGKLESRTHRTIFDRYAALGIENVSAEQSLIDAENITGLRIGLTVEYADLPKHVTARFDTERRVIEVSNRRDGFSRGYGATAMAEELLHAVDALTSNTTLSASSKRLDLKTGDIAQEIIDHSETSGTYAKYFEYPLADPSLSDTVKQAELFARLGVLYFGEPERMRQSLPLAYGAFDGIFSLSSHPVNEEVSRRIWAFTGRPVQVGSQLGADRGSASGSGRSAQDGQKAELGRLRSFIRRHFQANPGGAKVSFNRIDTRSLKTRLRAHKEKNARKPFGERLKTYRERQQKLSRGTSEAGTNAIESDSNAMAGGLLGGSERILANDEHEQRRAEAGGSDTAKFNRERIIEVRKRLKTASEKSQKATPTGGLSVSDVERIVAHLKESGLKIHVAATEKDLPQTVQERIKSTNSQGVRGVYLPATDEIWLVSSRLEDSLEVVMVTLHEARHRGLRKTYGKGLDPILRQIYATNARIRKMADVLSKSLDIGKEEAVEEVLADLPIDRARALNGWKKLVRFIKQWIAEKFDLTFTDEMVERLVAGAEIVGLESGEVSFFDDDAFGQIQTETPAFKKWFGDSKVVDADGRPKIMYHGTGYDISEFRPGEADAIFVTDDPGFANQFAMRGMGTDPNFYDDSMEEGLAPNIMPVYVSAQNPFDPAIKKHRDKVLDKLFPAGATTIETGEGESRMAHTRGEFDKRLKDAHSNWGVLETSMIQDIIKGLGHDGFYVNEEYTRNLAVYSSSQIKSATGNNGNFDGNNPDIRFARSGGQVGVKQKAKSLIDRATDSLIYNYQNRFVDLGRIQKRAAAVPENMDAVLAEERYSGRVRARTDDFHDDMRDPLIKAIHDGKLKYEEVEEYLHALHAPSRNAAMREINPTVKDLDARIKALAATRDKLSKDAKVIEFIQKRRDLRQMENDVEDGLADAVDAAVLRTEVNALQKEKTVKEYTETIDKLKATRNIKPFDGDNTALSGMSDDEAKAVIAKAKAGGKEAALQGISKMVDAITAATRKVIVDAGLETAETVKAWGAKYDHYVPLHRDEVGTGNPAIGRGFNVRGKETKRATGSNKEVTDILAHLVANHEAAIIRAEKSKVDNALFEFAKANPDPGLWTLDTADKIKTVDPVSGLVTERVDPAYKNRDNVLTLKTNGEEHTITFEEKNPEAMRLAASMKNLGVEQLGEVTKTVGKFTRFLATMNTTANPVFVVRNFLRDLQTAYINLSDTEVAGMKKQIFKDTPRAIRGMWKASRGDMKSEWAKYAREFRDAGGQTGWMEHYKDIGERAGKLRDQLKVMGPGKWNLTKRQASAWWQLVEDANGAVENGVRLAAYVNARKKGLSEGKAASLTKNLTVNFNKRGFKSTELNMWYMFMNASIQGSARLIQAMNNRQVQKIVGGVVASGFLLDILARSMAGDDDDDGENDYDQLPEHSKAMNFVFWADDRPVTIPMPYGYNFFASVGRKMSEMLFREGKTATSSALELAAVFFDAFSPVGQAGSFLQFAAPTIADPFVQWSENKNFAGNPMYREQQPFGVPKPEYQMGFKSTSAPSKMLAESLNDLTGGNEVRPGLVNVNPALFDFAVSSVAGGAGRSYLQAFSLPIKAAGDDEIQAREVPFANIFLSAKPEYQTEHKYFENFRSVKLAEEELKRYRGDSEMAKQLREEHAEELKLAPRAKLVAKLLEGIRKRERVIEKNDPENKRELKKELDERKKKLMIDFNRRYSESVTK